jgi:hypothetical protein
MGQLLSSLLEIFYTKKLDIVVIGLENRYVRVAVCRTVYAVFRSFVRSFSAAVVGTCSSWTDPFSYILECNAIK